MIANRPEAVTAMRTRFPESPENETKATWRCRPRRTIRTAPQLALN